jgi:hypothetical protein
MRFAIAALLVLHGLIHLLGWKLAPSRAVALVWTACAVALILAALLRLMDRDAWWAPAAIAIVVSQVLIVRQWSDAKAGTIANVILIVPIVVGFATARFHRENEEVVRELLARAPTTPPPEVTPADVANLPPPVRRWLETAGAVGKPRARTARLHQRGGMRTERGGPFLDARADQYFTVDEPGFVWTIDVTMMGIVPVVGRDTSIDGRGRMYIRAGGLITVADGTGERFDQGTLLRWLGEIVWFPSGALSPAVTWQAIDDRSARATVSHRGTSATAVFRFDERGRVVGLAAKRWFDGKSLEDWEIPITEWGVVRGVEIPTKGTAIWRIPQDRGGDFEYYRWEITDVEANAPALWSSSE